MKKYARTVIKGILLTLVFVLTFNLSLGQMTCQTTDNPSVLITKALADDDEVDMEFTLEEIEEMEKAAEEEDLKDLIGGKTAKAGTPTMVEMFPQEAYDKEGIIKDIAEWSTILHRIFHPMVNFLSFQIGNFLGIDYIYEGAMGQMIKKIWTVSRNLVNIIFVLILLALALREIFDIRGGGEGGKLKDYLIKFTLLLIAVNFSWLATKVVLDAANVATNIVFSIPMGVARTDLKIDYEPCVVKSATEIQGQCYPTAFYYPYDSDPNKYEYRTEKDCKREEVKAGYNDAYYTVTAEDAEGTEGLLEEGEIIEDRDSEYWGKSITCWDNLNLLTYDRNSSVVYLTYGMARIQNLVKASAKTSYAQLGVGIFMSLLLMAIYVVTLFALFVALIIRMAVLWIFVAFSPFLVLMIFSKKFEIAGEEATPLKFIRWAFVPVKVGAVFTVAFLMISAGQAAGYITGNYFEKLSEQGAITHKILKFDTLFVGMDTISEFIWLVMVMAVLWIGVFSVLKTMPIVDKITGTIQGLGNRAGTWMAKTPYYAPIVPIYDHKTGKWNMKTPMSVDPARSAKEWMNKMQYGDQTGAQITDLGNKAKQLKDPSIIKAIKNNQIDNNVLQKIAREVKKTPQELHALGEQVVRAAFSANENIDSNDASRIWSALDERYIGVATVAVPPAGGGAEPPKGKEPPPPPKPDVKPSVKTENK